MPATEGTGTTAAADPTQQTKGFFSLPRELRDVIYDLLHQHEVDAELGQLTLRFQHSLAHLRHISRRFTTECDLRMPAAGTTHLVVSQREGTKYFNAYHHPARLSTVATLRQDAFFREIEVEIEVFDHYAAHLSGRMSWINSYAAWIQGFLHDDPQLIAPDYGGKISVRLFFKYLKHLDLIVQEVSASDWYFDQCTTIDIVLNGVERLSPVFKRLGFHIYSEEPRTVATWRWGTGWEIDMEAIKHGRAEARLGQDLFATEAESKALEVDWSLVEDDNDDGMQG
jgi:hypothetical protein